MFPSHDQFGATIGTAFASPADKQLLTQWGQAAVDGKLDDLMAQMRKTSDGLYALDMIGYLANGGRRNLVSGQLGGKYLPNLPYQVENIISAPIIAYVTSPATLMTVLPQTFKSFLGITPYRQLRYAVAQTPDALLPGTRFTYAQVYAEFTARELGTSNAGLQLGDSFIRDIEASAQGFNRFLNGVPQAGTVGFKQHLKAH